MTDYVPANEIPAWRILKEFLEKMQNDILIPLKKECNTAKEAVIAERDRLSQEQASSSLNRAPTLPVDGRTARPSGTGNPSSEIDPQSGVQEGDANY